MSQQKYFEGKRAKRENGTKGKGLRRKPTPKY
jgi:hypothetical protein